MSEVGELNSKSGNSTVWSFCDEDVRKSFEQCFEACEKTIYYDRLMAVVGEFNKILKNNRVVCNISFEILRCDVVGEMLEITFDVSIYAKEEDGLRVTGALAEYYQLDGISGDLSYFPGFNGACKKFEDFFDVDLNNSKAISRWSSQKDDVIVAMR